MIIAQLSDLHIRADDLLCHGIADSMSNLKAAVNQLNRLKPSPDVVLLTGDLTDDGSEAEYRKLRACLDQLRIPFFIIPGNHDDSSNFRKVFADHRYLPEIGSSLHYVVEEFPLRLIGLDTTVAAEIGGRMCEARRKWLSERLREQPQWPTLIFMHHPPLKTGIFGLDQSPFSGATELEALIAGHPQVEMIVCGHVHRAITKRFGHTAVTTSPSTAYQFTCDLAEGAVLTAILEPGGYLVYTWSAEAGLVTHTRFINDYDGPFPLGT